MNGGTANRVTTAPDSPPTTPHARTATAQQATIPAAVACSAPAYRRISSVPSTADRAIRLPTDRSMPPAMMTSVMPAARMAITAIWLATLSRLSAFRKFGQR